VTALLFDTPEHKDTGVRWKLCFVRTLSLFRSLYVYICVCGGEGFAFQFSFPITETSSYPVAKLQRNPL